MKLRIKDIIEIVDGTVNDTSRLDYVVSEVSTLEEATADSISFYHNKKYQNLLYSSKAGVVMVKKNFVPERQLDKILIYVDDVYARLITILEKFNHVFDSKSGIEEPSFIGENTVYGDNVYVGAFAYLGKNLKIGDNVKIYPNCYLGDHVEVKSNTVLYAGVKIYTGCKIGENCILHSGCVIGSDGFGHAPQPDGSYKKIPQIGKVIIHNNVEVGANTTIDRAAIESTIIKSGVKLDNLIQIAHNVEIGENTVIAAQAGISGSTRIGKSCIIAGQAGFVGHIEIADGSQFGAKSGVSKSIKDKNGKWFGVPLMPVQETLRLHAILRKFPGIYKQILQMERDIKDIKNES